LLDAYKKHKVIFQFLDGPQILDSLKMYLAGVNLYFQGNMDNIMDEIPCSTIDDEPRFREFLKNAIDEGKIKSYKVNIYFDYYC